MSWMKYNKETGQIDLLPYISELSGFQAIVMDEHTWNIICKRSASAAPGKFNMQHIIIGVFRDRVCFVLCFQQCKEIRKELCLSSAGGVTV